MHKPRQITIRAILAAGADVGQLRAILRRHDPDLFIFGNQVHKTSNGETYVLLRGNAETMKHIFPIALSRVSQNTGKTLYDWKWVVDEQGSFAQALKRHIRSISIENG